MRAFRGQLRSGSRRVQALLPTLIQLALAVTAAYAAAHYGLGHEAPALACTVALSSLSLSRDARPSRVAQTAFAMVMGITLSATVVVFFGRGAIQILVTLLIVTSAATFLSKNPAFAISAGTQSLLVAVLADPPGGPYARALDGAVGGVVALLVTAALPYAPLRRARWAGRGVLDGLGESNELIRRTLTSGNPEHARQALTHLEQQRPALAAWRVSADAAVAVAGFSPVSRAERMAWRLRQSMCDGTDRLHHDLVMVARRAAAVTEQGGRQPRAAVVVQAISQAIAGLRYDHDGAVRGSGDQLSRAVVASLDEAATHSSVDRGLVAMLRPVVVDLLVAAGHTPDQARQVLTPVEVVVTTGIELPPEQR